MKFIVLLDVTPDEVDDEFGVPDPAHDPPQTRDAMRTAIENALECSTAREALSESLRATVSMRLGDAVLAKPLGEAGVIKAEAETECVAEVRRMVEERRPHKTEDECITYAATYAFNRGGEVASQSAADVIDFVCEGMEAMADAVAGLQTAADLVLAWVDEAPNLPFGAGANKPFAALRAAVKGMHDCLDEQRKRSV